MVVWYLCLLFMFLSYSCIILNCTCMCSKEFMLCKRDTTSNNCSYIFSLIVCSFLYCQSLYLSFNLVSHLGSLSLHAMKMMESNRLLCVQNYNLPLTIGHILWTHFTIFISCSICILFQFLNLITILTSCISSTIISYEM